jgi:hypothetical protein
VPVWVDPDAPTRAVEATITSPVPVLTTSVSGAPTAGGIVSSPATAIRLLATTSAATTSAVLDRGSYRGPAALVVTTTVGATPTETLDIQGSVDNVNFYNIAYALVATPNTVAVAQITITSAVSTTYLLLTDQAWRYLRLVTATITNVTTTATYYQ